MRGWLVVLVFVATSALLAVAAPENFPPQMSPDGKWLFEATFYGSEDPMAGWLTDIKETATGRIAMRDPKPHKNEMLPHRVTAHWSPDSQYLAIDQYYGRIAFNIYIFTLDHGKWVEADWPPPGHPRHMIHPADRGRWVDSSDINTSIEGWSDANTLQLTDSMRAIMVEPDGAREQVTSTRARILRFSGKIGHTLSISPPDYDELGN